MHAVRAGTGVFLEVAADYGREQIVHAVGVDVVKGLGQPVVRERIGRAALSEDHVDVRGFQPVVHTVQSHPPVQDVLDHQHDAVGIDNTIARVGRKLPVDHVTDAESADHLAEKREVTEDSSTVSGGGEGGGHGSAWVGMHGDPARPKSSPICCRRLQHPFPVRLL